MGDMADYYMEQAMMEDAMAQCELGKPEHFIAGKTRHPVQARAERYAVSEDDIRNLLFETSTKELCTLAETVLMEKYPPEDYDSNEWNKVVDIAAFGLVKKFLTYKQQWYLAGFIIFYSGR